MAAIGMSCCGSGIATFSPLIGKSQGPNYSVGPLATDLLSGNFMVEPPTACSHQFCRAGIDDGDADRRYSIAI